MVVLLKIAGALLCALLLYDIYRRYPKLGVIATSCATIFGAVVVLWNASLFGLGQGVRMRELDRSDSY